MHSIPSGPEIRNWCAVENDRGEGARSEEDIEDGVSYDPVLRIRDVKDAQQEDADGDADEYS